MTNCGLNRRRTWQRPESETDVKWYPEIKGMPELGREKRVKLMGTRIVRKLNKENNQIV